jgi:hypothetical protein
MSISTDPECHLAVPGVSDHEYASFLDATNIVNAIVAGTDSDPTNGALYYANLKKKYEWMALSPHRERSSESSTARDSWPSGVLCLSGDGKKVAKIPAHHQISKYQTNSGFVLWIAKSYNKQP